MRRWLQDLVRYAHQKLLPPTAWRHARDGRKRPEILPGTLWLTAWMGFLLQVPSVEQLERLAQRHFRRWLPRGQRPPSGDALRDGMDLAKGCRPTSGATGAEAVSVEGGRGS